MFSLSMAISIVPEDSRVEPVEIGAGGGGGGVDSRCWSSGRIGGGGRFSPDFLWIAFSMPSSILTVTGDEP